MPTMPSYLQEEEGARRVLQAGTSSSCTAPASEPLDSQTVYPTEFSSISASCDQIPKKYDHIHFWSYRYLLRVKLKDAEKPQEQEPLMDKLSHDDALEVKELPTECTSNPLSSVPSFQTENGENNSCRNSKLGFTLHPLPLLSAHRPPTSFCSPYTHSSEKCTGSPKSQGIEDRSASSSTCTGSNGSLPFPSIEYFRSKDSLPDVSCSERLAQEQEWDHWQSFFWNPTLLPPFRRHSSSFLHEYSEIPIEFRWGVKKSQLKDLIAIHKVSFPLDYPTQYYDWFWLPSTITLVAYTTPSGFRQLYALRQMAKRGSRGGGGEGVNPFGCDPYCTGQMDLMEMLGELSPRSSLFFGTSSSSTRSSEYCSVMVGFVSGHSSYPTLVHSLQSEKSLPDKNSPRGGKRPLLKSFLSFFSGKSDSHEFPKELFFVNPVMYIGSIAVHPVLRRSGVGGALLEAFIQYVVHYAPIHLLSFLHSRVQIYLEKSSGEQNAEGDPPNDDTPDEKCVEKESIERGDVSQDRPPTTHHSSLGSCPSCLFPSSIPRVPCGNHTSEKDSSILFLVDGKEKGTNRVSSDLDHRRRYGLDDSFFAPFPIRVTKWNQSKTPGANLQNTFESINPRCTSSSGNDSSGSFTSITPSTGSRCDSSRNSGDPLGTGTDTPQQANLWVKNEVTSLSEDFGRPTQNVSMNKIASSSAFSREISRDKVTDSFAPATSADLWKHLPCLSSPTDSSFSSFKSKGSSPFFLSRASYIISQATSPLSTSGNPKEESQNPIVQYGYKYLSCPSSSYSCSFPSRNTNIDKPPPSPNSCGDGSIWLHCLADNEPLLKFYTNRGFRIVQVIDEYYTFNDANHTAVQLCYMPSLTSPCSFSPRPGSEKMGTKAYDSSPSSWVACPHPMTALPGNISPKYEEDGVGKEKCENSDGIQCANAKPLVNHTSFYSEVTLALQFTASQIAEAVNKTNDVYQLRKIQKKSEREKATCGEYCRRLNDDFVSLDSLPLSSILTSWWFTPNLIHLVEVEPIEDFKVARDVVENWVNNTLFNEGKQEKDGTITVLMKKNITRIRRNLIKSEKLNPSEGLGYREGENSAVIRSNGSSSPQYFKWLSVFASWMWNNLFSVVGNVLFFFLGLNRNGQKKDENDSGEDS